MKHIILLLWSLLLISSFSYSKGVEKKDVINSKNTFYYLPEKVEVKPLTNISWLFSLKPISFKVHKIGEDGKPIKELKDKIVFGLDEKEAFKINKNIVLSVDGKPTLIYTDMLVYSLLRAVIVQREWICKQPNKPEGLCK